MKILFLERDLQGVMILGKPTMMIYKNRLVASFSVFFFAGKCAAQEVVNLYYYERPPYILEQADGTVGGILGARANEVFKAAGIPFIWQKTPAKRQLSEIRDNNEPACALGWYNLGDRASYANFTHPIYQDHGIVAIVRADFSTIEGATLQKYLADSALRVLIKVGLSYGPIVASQISRARAAVTFVTAEQTQLARMIASGRADMMFATVEEAKTLLSENESGLDALKILIFSDVSITQATELPRYIMCDKKVSPKILEKLNEVIDITK